MHRISIVLTGLAVMLMTADVSARGKTERHPQKQMDPQARAETLQKLASPSEPHKQLAKLAGKWNTTTKEWTETGKPSAESTGTAEFRMLLGDRFLQQEYTGQMMGQPFTGLGIDGYDNLRKKYVTIWMSSSSTGLFTMEGTGSADGRTIDLHGRHTEADGSVMQHHAVWKLVDDDNQTFELYGRRKGGKEMKVMEIIYVRQK